MKYSLKCTCGDVMTVDAENLDEAKAKLKEMMNPEMVSAHMAEKHPGEVVPSSDQVSAMVDAGTVEGDLNAAPAETPAV